MLWCIDTHTDKAFTFINKANIIIHMLMCSDYLHLSCSTLSSVSTISIHPTNLTFMSFCFIFCPTEFNQHLLCDQCFGAFQRILRGSQVSTQLLRPGLPLPYIPSIPDSLGGMDRASWDPPLSRSDYLESESFDNDSVMSWRFSQPFSLSSGS